MNRLIVVSALLFFIFTVTVYASPSIFIRVKEKKDTDRQTKWRSSSGSVEKDVFRGISLEIDLQNTLGTEETFTLQWYFFRTPIQRGDFELHEWGEEVISLGSREKIELFKTSTPVKANEARYRSYSGRYYSSHKSGMKMKGYVVVLVDEKGKTFKVTGTNRRFERIGRDHQQLQQMILDHQEMNS